MGSIGPWQVIIILLVVVLLFGAKKLPQIGKGMVKLLEILKNLLMILTMQQILLLLHQKEMKIFLKLQTALKKKKTLSLI